MPRATLRCATCENKEEVESVDSAKYRERFVRNVQSGWTVRPDSSTELLCPTCSRRLLDTATEASSGVNG